jgi:hypothetical protein
VRLPDSIEADLQRAAQVQAERDAARDIIAPEIKALRLGEEDGGERENGDGDETGLLYEELDALRKLAPQHIAIRRLHRLRRLLEAQGQAPTWLTQWARRDRQRWQATVGLARSARGRRRDLYRQVAHELASGYSAIVIEPLDLADAARIIDGSGERTEFTKAARAGRFVASLSEFDAALRWACAKHGTALFELTGKTASTCAHCGAAGVEAVEGQGQALQCGECGALTDRKSNAAAVAWQWASQGIEERIVDYHREQSEGRLAQQRAREDRRERMQAGRRTARTASEGAMAEGSRDGQVGVADEDSGATDVR